MNGVPPDEFRAKYTCILNREKHHLTKWFNLISRANNQVVLLCWCYPGRTSSLTGEKLFCHRILLGYWIEEYYPQFKVIYADGADNPIWER